MTNRDAYWFAGGTAWSCFVWMATYFWANPASITKIMFGP